MGPIEMAFGQRQSLLKKQVLAVVAATVLVLATSCKKKAAEPPLERPPVAEPVAGTTQTLAAVKFYAEVPKSVAARVIADANGAFASVPDAQKRWASPEEKALDYYHSTHLLAELGRAEGLSSSPLVLETLEDLLGREYSSRLFRRQTGEIAVADKEIEDYYKTHLSQYVVKGRFWIRHIFLNTVDNPGKEKEKEALAQKALEELKAGKLFPEVANKYSDAEGKKGEILDPPIGYGEINPDLEKAIVSLEPGQVTEVIKSKWGYNIFRLEHIERPTTRTLEMVRDSIVKQLRSEKSRTLYGQFLQQLEQNLPATRHYEVLSDPNATSDSVVAGGDFVKITVGDYRRRLAGMTPARRAALEEPGNRTQYLNNWVAWKRIEQAARANGVDRDPEVGELQRYVTDAMLAFAYLDRTVTELPAPQDEEIRKYYEDYRDYFTSEPAQVRLRELGITYKLAEGASKREYYLARKQAEAKIQDVAAKLKQGADFAALVRQHSNSGSVVKDGDLGFLVPTRWSQELASKVANLEIGQCTEPIEDREGFWIFRVEDRKPAVLYPLDESRRQYITEALLAQHKEEASARIRLGLVAAYRKNLPVKAIRRIVEKELAEARRKK